MYRLVLFAFARKFGLKFLKDNAIFFSLKMGMFGLKFLKDIAIFFSLKMGMFV